MQPAQNTMTDAAQPRLSSKITKRKIREEEEYSGFSRLFEAAGREWGEGHHGIKENHHHYNEDRRLASELRKYIPFPTPNKPSVLRLLSKEGTIPGIDRYSCGM